MGITRFASTSYTTTMFLHLKGYSQAKKPITAFRGKKVEFFLYVECATKTQKCARKKFRYRNELPRPA
jgi:hypothetical protein